MSTDDITISPEQFTEATEHYADVLFPLMAKTFNALPLSQSCRVLDIGCGDGSLSEHLVQHCPNIGGVSLIDYDAMLTQAAVDRVRAAKPLPIEGVHLNVLAQPDALGQLGSRDTVSFFSNISGYFTWQENAAVLSALNSRYVIGNFFVYNLEAHRRNLTSPLLHCWREANYMAHGTTSRERKTVEYVWDMGWRDEEGEPEYFTLQTMSEDEFGYMMSNLYMAGYTRVNDDLDYADFKQERLIVLERL